MRSSLRPVGAAAKLEYARLRNRLRRSSEELGDLSSFFAEPVVSSDGRTIDWYVQPDKANAVPVARLGDEERATVLAAVEAQLARMRQEGERLQEEGDPTGEILILAAAFPTPREDYIYVAGKAPNWQPIIVGWGYTSDRQGSAGGVLQGFAARPAETPRAGEPNEGSLEAGPIETPADPIRTQADEAVPRPVVAETAEPVRPIPVTAVRVQSGTARWWYALWALLPLLLLAIGWLLLRACGFGIPGYGPIPAVGALFCPGGSIAGDSARARDLTNAARQLERQIIEKETSCTADRGGGPSQDIASRLEREKAQTGELQVSLAWDGPSDLDLMVVCPGGEQIFFQRRSGCGGTLDVDMNAQRHSQTPIENIFWPQNSAQAGRYKVRVSLYGRQGESRPSIPFQIRIKNGADVRTIPGTVGQGSSIVDVTEFSR
jgi:hypothetical protein